MLFFSHFQQKHTGYSDEGGRCQARGGVCPTPPVETPLLHQGKVKKERIFTVCRKINICIFILGDDFSSSARHTQTAWRSARKTKTSQIYTPNIYLIMIMCYDYLQNIALFMARWDSIFSTDSSNAFYLWTGGGEKWKIRENN